MCDFEGDLGGAAALCAREAVWRAGWLVKVPQGSMGRLWSTLRVIALYCSPSLWCHKMDDVMVYNINSPEAGWLIPSIGRKRCRSSPNICHHARGTNTNLWLLTPAVLKGKRNMKGEPQWKYLSDFFCPVIQEIWTRTIMFARCVQIIGMKCAWPCY